MGRLGFEPRTIRLKAEYSTVELATLLRFCNFTSLPEAPGFVQALSQSHCISRQLQEKNFLACSLLVRSLPSAPFPG